MTLVTSSLQAKNESGGMIVSTRVTVHKPCAHTYTHTGAHTMFKSRKHRCGVCVHVPACELVCVRGGGSERVSLQM